MQSAEEEFDATQPLDALVDVQTRPSSFLVGRDSSQWRDPEAFEIT